MEPKSVNTTVSSVLQIAPSASSPDGAGGSALDFAQVIMASQGKSNTGTEQQDKKHSKGEAATDQHKNSDDTLVLPGNPLALKLFSPKPELTPAYNGAEDGTELASFPKTAGGVKDGLIEVDPSELTNISDALQVGTDVFSASEVGRVVGEKSLVKGDLGAVAAEASSAASSEVILTNEIAAVVAAPVVEVNLADDTNNNPALVTEAPAVVTESFDVPAQGDSRTIKLYVGQAAAENTAAPVITAAKASAAPLVAELPDGDVGAKPKQGALASTPEAPAGEPTVKIDAAYAPLAKVPLEADIDEAPVQKREFAALERSGGKTDVASALHDTSASDMSKLTTETVPVKQEQLVVDDKTDQFLNAHSPTRTGGESDGKATGAAVKASKEAIKMPEDAVQTQKPEMKMSDGAENPSKVKTHIVASTSSQPDRPVTDTGQVADVTPTVSNVQTASAVPSSSANGEARPTTALVAPQGASLSGAKENSAALAGSLGHKIGQKAAEQKPISAQTELMADEGDALLAAEKPVLKTKSEQNQTNIKAAKAPQVAEFSGPLRTEVKPISAPVVTTQATVAKQSSEAITQAAPVQVEIANQMKRNVENKKTERKIESQGLDEKLKQTVIGQRPEKLAPILETRVFRNAQVDAAVPLPAQSAEPVEISEAEQILNETMAPVSMGTGQAQSAAVSVTNTFASSQNLAALERWSNSIIDVQKQGWTQSLVRRVAAMPTNGGRLVITLQPASLGKITVSMSESRRGMDIRMRTETVATAALLNEAEARISQLMESSGMRLSSFSADTSGSFAENGNNSDKSDSNEQPDGQNNADMVQELPEKVEQSIAQQGDGLLNVIA